MTNINDNNYELWLLRYAEGELTENECAELERWLYTHPKAAEELSLYNESPRLQRDENIRFVNVPRHQTHSLWQVAWRWVAAASVVLALTVPGLRHVTRTQLASADNNRQAEQPENMDNLEMPRVDETVFAFENTPQALSSEAESGRASAQGNKKRVASVDNISIAQLSEVQQLETEVLAELDTTGTIVQLDEYTSPDIQYVDNLIVYDDESEASVECVANEVVYTHTENGINPVALFIGTFIKVTK